MINSVENNSQPQKLTTHIASGNIKKGQYLWGQLIAIHIMLIAITTTKLEILNDKGLWEMIQASRTDWPIRLGSIFLLIRGGGYYSVDHSLMNRSKK